MLIPFNHAYNAPNTERYLAEVLSNRHWSGDGPFTKKCSAFLSKQLDGASTLVTPSGTDALEMCAILLDLNPGDEIIMPSFTFSSTANAFVLRGAVPVFVDIREDTINLDENLIEKAITSKTKAVIPVHYAGVACEMDAIEQICKQHKLPIVEDAAHAIGSKYKGKALGNIGLMNAFSFHETKNFSSGEGGAFATSSAEMFARAEIIREKGTNRSQFFRGQIDKYRWVDLGSSFLPSEFQTAVLWSQLEGFAAIQEMRMKIWDQYQTMLAPLEEKGWLRRPVVPADCVHNAHLY
ncbi:MAG: dTDP-4-amino-4,6-dideoxygalactose transaminase, partial [Candidatus Obscuribacterales bacterium]|nr:dTDP-4-amino-4,6-dideoxygalactose transaminase [Candidatus Obscuribacterales bacterium]